MGEMMKVYQEINKRRQSDEMDVNSLTMFAEAWGYQQEKIDILQKENDRMNTWYKNVKLQLENKQIDCDRSDRKIDEVLKACNNLRTGFIREHCAEYDKGWKDCATTVYHQLKRVEGS